jgi:chromate reductase, NAD(P)H dehydrogenase (quinone)
MPGLVRRLHRDVNRPRRLLLISGSLRDRSTNTAVLRTAEATGGEDVATSLYVGLASLPHFNPDDDREPLPPAVADLRSQIRSADAVLFSTPEYAGALPGSFKNLLDWAVGDDQAGSMYEKPVGWINASPRGAVNAHESLRLVLGYLHARVIEAACVQIPVAAPDLDHDGLIASAATRRAISDVLVALAGRSLATAP